MCKLCDEIWDLHLYSFRSKWDQTKKHYYRPGSSLRYRGFFLQRKVLAGLRCRKPPKAMTHDAFRASVIHELTGDFTDADMISACF